MKRPLFQRRPAALFISLVTAFSLAAPVLAADTPSLLNGTQARKPQGLAVRDVRGEGHTATHYGLPNITDSMRSSGPAYYSTGKVRPAAAPGEPAPKAQSPLTPGELARKYNITILDKPGYLSGPYGAQATAILDAGLERYSAEFVRTLVEKWAGEGVYVCINLYYPADSDGFKGATELNETTLCVNLCVPKGENPGGISVGTVTHEFGHAVFSYLEKRMGEQNLAEQWAALNGPYAYGSQDPGRAHAFVSGYGSLYYYEDPATLFEAFADAPEITANKLAQKDYALLKKKAEFLEQCVENYIGTPGTLFSAVWDAIGQAE